MKKKRLCDADDRVRQKGRTAVFASVAAVSKDVRAKVEDENAGGKK